MFIIITIWACNKLLFLFFWEWACWFNPIRMLADGVDEDAAIAAAAFFQIVMCWQSIIFGFNVIWCRFTSSHSSTRVHLTQCIVFLLTLFKRCMFHMMFCCCSAFRFLYLIIFHSLTSILDFYFNLKKCNVFRFFLRPHKVCRGSDNSNSSSNDFGWRELLLPLPLTSWTVNVFFFLRFSLMRLFLFFYIILRK